MLQKLYGLNVRPCLSTEMTSGFLLNLFKEKVKAMFLCAPAKDFMKDRFDEINKFPGDHIPIPGTYDQSAGIGGVPKTFFGSIPQFWIEPNSLDIQCPVHILHPENDELW